jgi:hypothetical protein
MGLLIGHFCFSYLRLAASDLGTNCGRYQELCPAGIGRTSAANFIFPCRPKFLILGELPVTLDKP